MALLAFFPFAAANAQTNVTPVEARAIAKDAYTDGYSNGIHWIPDVAHPVFFGVADTRTTDGAQRSVEAVFEDDRFQFDRDRTPRANDIDDCRADGVAGSSRLQ
jgi:hypothetical protein